MRLFSFTTTSVPKYEGVGVDWEDGKATYRVSLNGAPLEPPINGKVSDLAQFYGGLPGYSLEYEDEA